MGRGKREGREEEGEGGGAREGKTEDEFQRSQLPPPLRNQTRSSFVRFPFFLVGLAETWPSRGRRNVVVVSI